MKMKSISMSYGSEILSIFRFTRLQTLSFIFIHKMKERLPAKYAGGSYLSISKLKFYFHSIAKIFWLQDEIFFKKYWTQSIFESVPPFCQILCLKSYNCGQPRLDRITFKVFSRKFILSFSFVQTYYVMQLPSH